MREKIIVKITEFVSMTARGEDCRVKFERLLEDKNAMWKEEPFRFMFFARTWLLGRDCYARFSLSKRAPLWGRAKYWFMFRKEELWFVIACHRAGQKVMFK